MGSRDRRFEAAVIPLGILASSNDRTLPGPSPDPEPTAIRQVQEWSIATGGSMASGPPTSAGNLLIARAVHRQGSSGRAAAIGDIADNEWHLIAAIAAGGSGDVAMWYCENAHPTGAVNVAFDSSDASRYISIVEWEGVAKTGALLDSAAKANLSQVGNLPVAAANVSVPGAMIAGTLGATVSNRTIVLSDEALAQGYVPGFEMKASQLTMMSANRLNTPVGIHGPEFTLSGSGSTTGVITAAFRPA